jgi:hypothetical protein
VPSDSVRKTGEKKRKEKKREKKIKKRPQVAGR